MVPTKYDFLFWFGFFFIADPSSGFLSAECLKQNLLLPQNRTLTNTNGGTTGLGDRSSNNG